MLNTRVVEMQALSFIISATLPNSFYDACIILIIINQHYCNNNKPKPDKDATGKKITGQHTCKSPQQNTSTEGDTWWPSG